MAGRRMGKSTIVSDWAKTLEEFVDGYRLELSVGKVYGKEYYCAKPIGWIWRSFEWKDMADWCDQTMGPHPKDGVWEPDQRWYMNGEQFWFREEKDRSMFVMRWS